MHHVYFVMTMGAFILVGSFFIDILQSDEVGVSKEKDNQTGAPDQKTVR